MYICAYMYVSSVIIWTPRKNYDSEKTLPDGFHGGSVHLETLGFYVFLSFVCGVLEMSKYSTFRNIFL